MDGIWKAAGSILGTVAPTIATALGGPLAGQAVSFITKALGLPSDTPEQQVAQALQNATPEQLLALKQGDQQFAIHMRELDVDLERIAGQDRDSARRRQVETKDKAPQVLAFVIIAGFLGCVIAVLGGFVDGLRDPITNTTVGMLIGYVSAKADQVVSFYFGSTASSRHKDETIKKMAG